MSRTRRRLHSIKAIRGRWPVLFVAIAIIAFASPLALAAKGGIPGKPPPGPSTQKVTTVRLGGTVFNDLTTTGVAGASVTYSGASGTFNTTTDSSGSYSFKSIPADIYSVLVTASNFNDGTLSGVNLQKGGPSRVVNVTLSPVANVVVTPTVSGNPAPDASLTLNSSCTPMDGSTIQGQTWSQTEGVPATIDGSTLTLGSVGAYKVAMIDALAEPPITADQLPPELADRFPALEGDPSDFGHGLQDQWQITGINPFAEEVAADVALTYTCETSSGTYTASTTVTTSLPWVVSTGLATVPVNQGVLLYGKCGAELTPPDEEAEDEGIIGVCPEQATWNWIVTPPAGSQVTALQDADTQTPWFTPDQFGEYQLLESVSGHTMSVYAGYWKGVIDPVTTLNSVLFGDGRPVADATCTGCHRAGPNGVAPDMFTPWRQTGHAEIFTQNMTPPGNSPTGHYGPGCFSCHTVGFDTDPTAQNNGFDDLAAYANFGPTDPNDHHGPSGLINSGLDGWLYMLEDMDADGNPLSLSSLTRLANVQCEHCHGPQDYAGDHGFDNPAYDQAVVDKSFVNPRVSISANVCATCHGEPARHARFQQWQISGHSDYELAQGEGPRSNCTRCHSGDGFIVWTTKYANDPWETLTDCEDGVSEPGTCDITWNADTVQPQTCATCHEPHNTGTTSGSADTNAPIRVEGDTALLVAGFQAFGAGKGAVCMECHNSRRGQQTADDGTQYFTTHDDAHWDLITNKTQTSHPPAQADVLEGQNAYFVKNVPGAHASIDDTCVNCHMDKTLPPQPLYVNGTNHTFVASPNVCSNCHGSGVTADGVQNQVTGLMGGLLANLGAGYQRLMTSALPVDLGAVVRLNAHHVRGRDHERRLGEHDPAHDRLQHRGFHWDLHAGESVEHHRL